MQKLFRILSVFIVFLAPSLATAAEPNYGLYTSLLNAYNYQYGPLASKLYSWVKQGDDYAPEHTWGILYTGLEDLNGDGVDEFIVLRAHKNDEVAWGNEIMGLDSAERHGGQVFTIKNGELVHLWSFDPMSVGSDVPGLNQLSVATVGNLKYIVTGNEGGDWNEGIFWQMTADGFKKAVTLDNFNELVDGSDVGKAKYEAAYKKWYADIQNTELNNVNRAEVEKLRQNNDSIKSTLAKFPSAQGASPSAAFRGKRFVIFEDTPTYEAEKAVRDYYVALIMGDAKALETLLPPASEALEEAANFEGGTFIVDEFYFENMWDIDPVVSAKISEPDVTIERTPARIATVLHKDAQELALAEYAIVRVVLNEKATDENPSGLKNRWFLVGQKTKDSPWKLYEAYE